MTTSSDPYRSACPRCDGLRDELRVAEQSIETHISNTESLIRQLNRLRTQRGVTVAAIIVVCGGLFVAGWYIKKMPPSPEPPCRNSVEVVKEAGTTYQCPTGATLTLEHLGREDIEERTNKNLVDNKEYLLVRCRCPGQDERAAHEP